jgi:hypothetical protein
MPSGRGLSENAPSTNSVALLIRCSGWLVKEDVDGVVELIRITRQPVGFQ